MPKRSKPAPAEATLPPRPEQLPLFADTASLVRVQPEPNEHRYYRAGVWPDLFGRALLMRHWGRIGSAGHQRLDPHPDSGAALNALARLTHVKRRRGYQDRTS
ncbi:MAG: WGR domain-containing protein [Janthinobacterium lividum]